MKRRKFCTGLGIAGLGMRFPELLGALPTNDRGYYAAHRITNNAMRAGNVGLNTLTDETTNCCGDVSVIIVRHPIRWMGSAGKTSNAFLLRGQSHLIATAPKSVRMQFLRGAVCTQYETTICVIQKSTME